MDVYKEGWHNHGCRGGSPFDSYRWIKKYGLASEASYPYDFSRYPDWRDCRHNQSEIVARISGYVQIPQYDEELMKIAVATVGPISAAINFCYAINFYKDPKRIVNDSVCLNKRIESLDHAVLIVGYGVSSEGEEYWIIKNSWGTKWQDNGYIKIARNVNFAGIAFLATYPVIKTD